MELYGSIKKKKGGFPTYFLPPPKKIPWYSVDVTDLPKFANLLVSFASRTLWTTMLSQDHQERE